MELISFLTTVTQQRGADLFIIAGAPCCMRVDKTLQPLNESKLLPNDTEALVRGSIAWPTGTWINSIRPGTTISPLPCRGWPASG